MKKFIIKYLSSNIRTQDNTVQPKLSCKFWPCLTCCLAFLRYHVPVFFLLDYTVPSSLVTKRHLHLNHNNNNNKVTLVGTGGCLYFGNGCLSTGRSSTAATFCDCLSPSLATMKNFSHFSQLMIRVADNITATTKQVINS